MRRLAPHLAPLGYSPRRYLPLSPAPVLGMGERLTDLREMQLLFANGELGGYWPADPAYAYEDSAGTTAASVDGVVGYRTDVALGKHAVQATTANKPYLRRTPTTNKPWYDSNTSTGALNVTFASALGRRNLLTHSEAILTDGWIKTSTSIYSENSAIAPNGTMTAGLLTESASNSALNIYQAITGGSAGSFTFSVYLKALNRNWVCVGLTNSANTGVWFNLTTGAIGTAESGCSGTISDAGGGWWRCSCTKTLSAGTQYPTIEVGSANGNRVVGVAQNAICIWGIQLDTGNLTEYQKIVAGPSAVLDPVALTTTYPQNISATTNCTIACVTPEGVVIADNQTVGTTYNITPPYGYNSDVLIINRALTPAEKALVKRVMQRSVPTLESE